MASVTCLASAGLGKAAVGCFVQGSRLWVFAGTSLRVPLSVSLPDDLPLLCCDMRASSGMALAVGAGLCPTQLLCGILVSGEEPSAAEETTKRARTEEEMAVSVASHSVSVSDRGCINAVAVQAAEGPARQQWSVAVFLGCQSGEVVRLSLLASLERVVVVGSEAVVAQHRMDVRSLALSPGSRLCSCGDDGVVQVAQVQGGTLALIEPLCLWPGAEALCCVFEDEGTVWVGTRQRVLARVELGLDGARKKRDATWVGATVPQVPRWVGRGGVFNNGRQLFRRRRGEGENEAWEEVTEPLTLEDARAFQSVPLPTSLLLGQTMRIA